jgi:hypothetical protein
MNHTPVAIHGLLARYKNEYHRLVGTGYNSEQLCQDYIEPLLMALGWDVTNSTGVRDEKKPVEALLLKAVTGSSYVYAYLLHEQSYRYWRHYLIGVSQPPLERYSTELLALLEHTLNRSSFLIETLALTDFSKFHFYDNTPGSHPAGGPKRARLYSLPCRHYPAWWGELHGWDRLGFNPRAFDLYAAKLRNWAGVSEDPDNIGDAVKPA